MFTHYYKPQSLNSGWRIYEFDHAYQAEEFAELFGGVARTGRNENGKWIVLI